jgi:hypothetical protein
MTPVIGDYIRLSNREPFMWYRVTRVEQQPHGFKITYWHNGSTFVCYDDDVMGIQK